MSGGVTLLKSDVADIKNVTDTGQAGTITAINHVCNTAAATTFTWDINENGTTIYTTQGNRPTRTAGNGTTLVTATAPDDTALAANSVITLDLDTAGTTLADFTLVIFATEP